MASNTSLIYNCNLRLIESSPKSLRHRIIGLIVSSEELTIENPLMNIDKQSMDVFLKMK